MYLILSSILIKPKQYIPSLWNRGKYQHGYMQAKRDAASFTFAVRAANNMNISQEKHNIQYLILVFISCICLMNSSLH
jgi:hypothetical protein